MQLYTVHRLTNYRSIAGPYAPLPNKRKATYVEMLTEVQRQTHKAMLHSLMTDFESSMLSALNRIYPAITQVGCLFHLSMRVFRPVIITLDYKRTTLRIHYSEVIFARYLCLGSFWFRM